MIKRYCSVLAATTTFILVGATSLVHADGGDTTQRALQKGQDLIREAQTPLSLPSTPAKQEASTPTLDRSTTDMSPETVKQFDSKTCYHIDAYQLISNKPKLADTLISRSMKEWIGQNKADCVNKDDLFELIKKSTNIVLNKGYVTSLVFYPEQNLNTHELTLNVQFGLIEKIKSDQISDRQIKFAFAKKMGDVLNLKDIEQGLANLKKITSIDAAIDLIPGNTEYQTIVQVNTNKTGSETRVLSQWSASHSDLSRRLRGALTVQVDDLLALNDALSMGVSKSLYDSADDDSTGYNISWSIPYGYYGLNMGINNSDYESSIQGSQSTISSNGDQINLFLELSRLLWNDTSKNESLSMKLQQTKAKTYLNNEKVFVSSPDINKIGLSASGYHVLSGNVICQNDITYEVGRVEYDHFDHLNFDKQKLSLGCDLRLKKAKMSVSTALQYANKPLVSQEQFSLTGEGGIAGFSSLGLSGSRAGSLKVTWAQPLVITSDLIHDSQWSMSVAKGWVPHTTANTQSGSLMGIEASFLFRIGRVNAQMFVSKGLKSYSSDGYGKEGIESGLVLSIPLAR